MDLRLSTSRQKMNPGTCLRCLAVFAAFWPVVAISGDLIPDSFRAVDVKWPQHELKDRSWRYLLGPEAQEMEVFKGEPFARDAGCCWLFCETRHVSFEGSSQYGFKDREPDHRFIVGEPRASKAVLERMHDVPFMVYEHTRRIVDLPTAACDIGVFDRLAGEYPETFLGAIYGEWDAGLLYRLRRKQSDLYKQFARRFKMPCGREELAQHFYDYWDEVARLKGPRPLGLSGPCNLGHISVERGSTMAFVELTLEQSWRAMMMHMRGAGRQFDVPLGYYVAYFLGAHTADTRAGYEARGENWGIAPNLAWRTILLGYYQGCNYQCFESFPWAFVKKVGKADGGETIAFTENGEVLRRAYDFIRGPEGARGAFYAPILLLADWAHGHDGLNRRISIKDGWGPFASQCPPTIYDQFYQDVLDAISPAIPGSSKLTRWCADYEYQCGLVNSRLGDIFDIYIANPRTKGKELRADQLAKYPVVMSLGGIKWTDDMKRLLRDYVAAGGTFVDVEGETPVLKQKLGYGNVLTAPRDKAKLSDFLLRLQREVLPVGVDTECELVWNVMPDGSWRVCAANNAGVEKHSDSSETIYHDAFARELRFVPPRGRKVEIREVLAGEAPAKGLSWTIPPGGVRVFELKGLDCHAKAFDLSKIEDPDMLPYEFPLKFEHDSACDYDFARIRADYETDEVTVECLAKPKPLEAWLAEGRKNPDGAPFMVGSSADRTPVDFGPCWKEGRWCLKRGTNWLMGPEADANRFTKLAATLKDGVLHFFVDDREVFGEAGPLLPPERTPKGTFYNCYTFWRGSASDRLGHRFLGEVKDCRAYTKAIYPFKYPAEKYGAKGNGVADDTAAIQRAIDAAVENTGEVVLEKGAYKVSRLQMKTGVTLHLSEGAVLKGTLCANGVTDFTILGPGTIDGSVLFENSERGCVRRLRMKSGGKCVVRGSKNIVFEDSASVDIDNCGSSRILVDGRLL